MNTISIGIIGCGPWGLAVFERIITRFFYESQRGLRVVVHIIEPERPGVGVYSDRLPDYLLLNTECGQIDLFGHKYMNSDFKVPYQAMSFYEWLKLNEYMTTDNGERREVRANDFLPRKWLGEYLHWVFETIASNLPFHISLRVHKLQAMDIINQGDNEVIELEDESKVTVDFLFLTIGHLQSTDLVNLEEELDSYNNATPLPPFPHQRVNSIVKPGERVFLAGMGLSSIDVISYLTIGRGGRYAKDSKGELKYIPSGQEPEIVQFSRTGLPYLSRPSRILDTADLYQPYFLTREKINELKRNGRKIQFREEILPLLWLEMKATYYQKTAELMGNDIVLYLREFREQAFGYLQEKYGVYNPELLFWGPKDKAINSHEYQTNFIQQLDIDIAYSKSEMALPEKVAIELIRVVRDLIRYAVDFDSLSDTSFIDFRENILPFFYRAVVGPPVIKTEELRALNRAGLLKQPFGMGPEIQYIREQQCWVVRSKSLKEPIQLEATHLILGFISTNNFHKPSSKLLESLIKRGRVVAYKPENKLGCGIDTDDNFHPINRQSGQEKNIYVLGLLTDGKRNFNLYIPSPKSRIRAFLDADHCVLEIFRRSTEAVYQI